MVSEGSTGDFLLNWGQLQLWVTPFTLPDGGPGWTGVTLQVTFPLVHMKKPEVLFLF